MAGCNKMGRAGLQFLRETFMNNPNIPFTQLLALYNMKAVDRGWRCLKSSGTLSYHLNAMGLYKYNTRHIVPHEKKRVWIYQGRRFTTRGYRQTVFYYYTYCAFGTEF